MIQGTYTLNKPVNAGDLVRMLQDGTISKLSSALANTFSNGNPLYISTTLIDSNKVLVAYRDGYNSNYGKAVILSISGTNITVNSTVTFSNVNPLYISTTLIDSNRVLVAYQDYTNSPAGKAVILSISGTNITVNSPVTFSNGNPLYISTTLIDSNRVLVAYRDNTNSNYGKAVILSISGTNITVNSTVTFLNGNPQDISTTLIDSNRVLVAYRDNTNSNYGKAVILSISGTNITVNSTVTFSNVNPQDISTTLIDSSRVLVAYRDGDNSNYGKAVILSISGTNITVNTLVTFSIVNPRDISTTLIDSNRVLVAYRDGYNSNYGKAVILSISGTNIAVYNSVTFSNGNPHDISTTLIDSSRVLVAYGDGYNSNYGKAVILSITNILGIALDNSGKVLLQGLYNKFSNLISGSDYYIDSTTKQLTTTSANNIYLGKAITPTAIYIENPIILTTSILI